MRNRAIFIEEELSGRLVRTERDIDTSLPEFLVPIIPPMSVLRGIDDSPLQLQVKRYIRHERLPNNLVVYTLVGQNWNAWHVTQSFRGPCRNTKDDWDRLMGGVDRERRDHLNSLGLVPGSPSPTLWEETRFDTAPGPWQYMYKRRSVGVGRKA